ncbi:MAG: nucleotidyl transferase AbiEii/AbiGii toxin family protein [Rhodospirillaceae bacterium]|nr:nucleotidyl transferase AbiEii/AbiGii toxin family protein [Rhodospirillaceae bacterium]MDD9998855.1 nucleotidyl transferase AbiEii/AbiGii toxin family protein [Rhodospirillaceae bacterium]MDE0362028.1 nucleotidyl transferase AbiEii/AbiGii toxin family protein [Rhodospirillaceae bacterium]
MDEQYVDQVRLLLRVLPDIAAEDVFALKGGTAINLFYREMPRLSVDIDLAYLPVNERKKSLQDIDETLDRIVAAIGDRNPGLVAERIAGGGDNDTRLLVSDGPVRVKIETSPVTRGTVCAPVTMRTSDAVTERFGFVETSVVAFEDLYGGKLHAALEALLD